MMQAGQRLGGDAGAASIARAVAGELGGAVNSEAALLARIEQLVELLPVSHRADGDGAGEGFDGWAKKWGATFDTPEGFARFIAESLDTRGLRQVALSVLADLADKWTPTQRSYAVWRATKNCAVSQLESTESAISELTQREMKGHPGRSEGEARIAVLNMFGGQLGNTLLVYQDLVRDLFGGGKDRRNRVSETRVGMRRKRRGMSKEVLFGAVRRLAEAAGLNAAGRSRLPVSEIVGKTCAPFEVREAAVVTRRLAGDRAGVELVAKARAIVAGRRGKRQGAVGKRTAKTRTLSPARGKSARRSHGHQAG